MLKNAIKLNVKRTLHKEISLTAKAVIRRTCRQLPLGSTGERTDPPTNSR